MNKPCGMRAVNRAASSPLCARRTFVERPGFAGRLSGSRCSRHMRRNAEEMDDLPKTYASALLELAEKHNVLDDIHTDVDTLLAVFINEPEVKDFLADPVGRRKEKRQVIEELKDSANLSEHTINFLKVLLQDGRLQDASVIFNNFENLYCERTDTEVATVYSPVLLEEEQKFKVAKEVQQLTNADSVKLKNVIDKSIIAGFIIDYGSEQIDLSVRGKLEDVAQELVDEAASLN